MIRKILVPVDFSEPSRAALAEASRIGEATGAELLVLYVDAFPDQLAGERPFLPAHLVKEHAETVRRHLDAFAEDAALLGCSARTLVISGSVAHGILDVAADEKVDLIVMGTHARNGLSRLVLGSVAEHVVRTATVPVLTVRNAPERDAATASAAESAL